QSLTSSAPLAGRGAIAAPLPEMAGVGSLMPIKLTEDAISFIPMNCSLPSWNWRRLYSNERRQFGSTTQRGFVTSERSQTAAESGRRPPRLRRHFFVGTLAVTFACFGLPQTARGQDGDYGRG